MDQALTNKKFIEQIDDVIETLGGTPVDLELTEDREDDMVSNDVFIDKMDEVIEALGGTPSEIIVGDDEADDMVSDNIFQLKMEDVVKNIPSGGGGGGGGGSSDFSIATITVYNPNSNAFYMYVPNVYGGVMYNSVGKDDISEPVDIVLYNGRATADLTGVGLFSDATGDITLDGTTRAIITGNGTITIS